MQIPNGIQVGGWRYNYCCFRCRRRVDGVSVRVELLIMRLLKL